MAYNPPANTAINFTLQAYTAPGVSVVDFNLDDPSSGVTGTSATSQKKQTGTGSGTFTVAPVTGTSTTSQKKQTGTASGAVAYTGTSSTSQKVQTGTGSGTIQISGTSATSQTAQTGTGAGTSAPPGVSGVAETTQARQAGSGEGRIFTPARFIKLVLRSSSLATIDADMPIRIKARIHGSTKITEVLQ